jgi:hypothetical protein
MFIVGACYRFFKWAIFPEVSFRSTVPTPRIEITDPFSIRMEEDNIP